MRILGVDPGSRLCGYGVIEVSPLGKVRYVECGVITPPRTAGIAARLAEIARELAGVIAECQPAEAAVESGFFGVNARAALQLGHARGVALCAAGLAGLPVAEYAPATVKRAVTGSGLAQKRQVQAMVRVMCGLKQAPRGDAADALAVAICHGLKRRTRGVE